MAEPGKKEGKLYYPDLCISSIITWDRNIG
jgi:hypothetical protein